MSSSISLGGRQRVRSLVFAGVAVLVFLSSSLVGLAQQPCKPGQWAGPFPWGIGSSACPPQPTSCIFHELGHAILLLTGPNAGKVLLWAYMHDSTSYTALFYLFDPANPTNLAIINQNPPLSANIFCSSHIFRPDGTIVAAGGVIEGSCPPLTAKESWLFNPATSQWSALPLMNYFRFYPTIVPVHLHPNMAAGDPLAIGGTPDFCHHAQAGLSDSSYVEGWEYLTSAGWLNSIQPVPPVLVFPSPTIDYFRWYPHTFGLADPSGTTEAILIAGDTHVLWGGQPNQVFNVQTKTFALFPWSPTTSGSLVPFPGPALVQRYYGSSVLIHDLQNQNRILRFGGSTGPSFAMSAASTLVEEWNPVTQTWGTKSSLLGARVFRTQ